MIYFFSGTGNSEYVAKRISNIIDDKKLISINSELKKNLRRQFVQDEERVGFVIPVHFFNIPKIVQLYINELTFLNYTAQYFYLVLTYSNSCGAADKNLSELLINKGVILNGVFKIRMPTNYIFGFSKVWDENKQSDVLKKSESKIASASNIIRLRLNTDERPADFISEPFFNMLNRISIRHKTSSKKFYADDKCNYCGLCEIFCPDGCITIIEKKPIWQNTSCSKCTACINRCPKKSIQYGSETVTKKRYLNPYLPKHNLEI